MINYMKPLKSKCENPLFYPIIATFQTLLLKNGIARVSLITAFKRELKPDQTSFAFAIMSEDSGTRPYVAVQLV